VTSAMQTMQTVQTVRGAVEAASLGRVLMHEHLFIVTHDYWLNHPDRQGFDEERDVAEAIRALNELKAAGIDTIVDLTVMGQGRFLPRVQRVAAQTELNIVAATGLYAYSSLPMPFHYQGPGAMLEGPEPLTELFVGDIVDGIAGTGVKAGVIKCSTDAPGMLPEIERAVRAAARASVQTGAPISTHTDAAAQTGTAQLRVFQEEGVQLSRVVIGHSGDTEDIDYLVSLLATGASVGMDRFGTDFPLTTQQRVDVIAELCRQGFSQQIVVSHDAAVFNDFTPVPLMRALAPEWGYTFIPRVLPGKLQQAGLSEAEIDDILVANPRRVLAGA